MIENRILLMGGKFVQQYQITANKTSMYWGDAVMFTITPKPPLKSNKQLFWKLIGNTTITSSMVRSGGIQGSPTLAANTPLNITLTTDVLKTTGIQIQMALAETLADLNAGVYKTMSPNLVMTASPTSSATLSTPTTSATWTVPANVYKFTATVDGAGGGAGGNYAFYGSKGGLGGNGGRVTYTTYTTPGTQFSYKVGTGGAGGSDGLDGKAGTESSFTTNVGLPGGGGFASTVRNGQGAAGTNGGNGQGSLGGQSAGSSGTGGKIVITW